VRQERRYHWRRRIAGTGVLLVVAAIAATSIAFAVGDEDSDRPQAPTAAAPHAASPSASPIPTPSPARAARPDVYAADTDPRGFAPAVAGDPERVYVPNTLDGTVSVTDPHTYTVVRTIRVGGEPHHITPAWNLRRLYIDDPYLNRLIVLDPRTAKVTGSIPVSRPYNLYFTPDGTKAIVVAEGDNLIEFRNPHTWKLLKRVSIPFRGVDHMDFSANGRFLLVSCEYTGVVFRISTVRMKITGAVHVGGFPVDVKLSPNGKVFYVANQALGGVSVIDPVHMRQIRFIRTGDGAHGFAVSRDATKLYVSNRIAGSISVIDFSTRRVVATWHIGGSPDMLQVSPSGKQLWTSNRFGNTVTVVSTRTGRVLHVIAVGRGPHGLSFFPQPGRFSIGHNGVYR
jgi:YVTN family beta-propeller protein